MNYFTKANILANSTIALAQSHLQEEIKVGSYMIQVKSRLAEGGFGVIDLVSDMHTKKDFVLKRCNIDRPESFEIAKKEISMLQKFKGPHIVNLLDSTIVQKNKASREALLLLEYYPGGHLLNRLLERGSNYLPVETVLRMFGQLCLGISTLHLSRPPIVHRDIKLENVLFGEDGKIRLCDFGSCVESPTYIRNMEERNIVEEHILKETTQMYRAPEMVDLYMRSMITEKTDIWALGCMLYAMCFLIHPFQDGSTLSILNAKVTFPTNSSFPQDVHELILRMLDVDPECRPNITEVIESTKALASGQSLPTHELSQEAELCRQNRIEANKIRESKLKSKVKSTMPTGPKKAIAVNSNSAAARRLAAMRGGGQQPVISTSNITLETTSSRNNTHTLVSKANNQHHQITEPQEILDFDFDPFELTNNVDTTKQSTFPTHTTTTNNNNSNSGSNSCFSRDSSNGSNGFDSFNDNNSFDPFNTNENNFSKSINTTTNNNNTKEQDLFFASPGIKKQPSVSKSITTNSFLSFDDDNNRKNDNDNSLLDFDSDFNQSNTTNTSFNHINNSNSNINSSNTNNSATPSRTNSRNPSFTSNQLFQPTNPNNSNMNDDFFFSPSIDNTTITSTTTATTTNNRSNNNNTIELTNQFTNEFNPFNSSKNNESYSSLHTSNNNNNNNNSNTPIPAKPPKPVPVKLNSNNNNNNNNNNSNNISFSPTKPIKTILKEPSAPSLIDFDDVSSNNNNSLLSTTIVTDSFAITKGPPKPSKRQSVQLIDFNTVNQTIFNNNINNNINHSNGFTSNYTDLLDMSIPINNTTNSPIYDLLDLPNTDTNQQQQQQQQEQQIKQMNNNVLNLYNLPRGPPPPVPTTAPPGIKPMKPINLSQQQQQNHNMIANNTNNYPLHSIGSPTMQQQQNHNIIANNSNNYPSNSIGSPTMQQQYNLHQGNSSNQKQYQANNPFNF